MEEAGGAPVLMVKFVEPVVEPGSAGATLVLLLLAWKEGPRPNDSLRRFPVRVNEPAEREGVDAAGVCHKFNVKRERRGAVGWP